jgi:hypothetical protein
VLSRPACELARNSWGSAELTRSQPGGLGTGALPGLVARPVLPEVPEGLTYVGIARRAIAIWTPGIGETPLELVIPERHYSSLTSLADRTFRHIAWQ